MKRIIFSALACGVLALGSCNIDAKTEVYAPRDRVQNINPSNFESLTITLYPQEFQIYVISNYTENLLDNDDSWWKDAVVYQVYVRSFKDSDGDGHGDLKGLISKLDYITNVGFDAIWTLPVFEAFHDGTTGRALGYEAIDYYKINPNYGNMADFEKYISEAKKKGIKVIMDMVINHNAKESKWFQASVKRDEKYDSWYIWTNASYEELENAGWKLPWGGGNASRVWHYDETRKEFYYATWGGELNFNNPEVREEGKNIARFWLGKGVDGFRLDAIRYLIEEGPHPMQADTPSSLEYLKEYQAAIKEANPKAMTVGEVWESDTIVEKYYMDGTGFDQCFSFAFQYTIRDALRNGNAEVLKGAMRQRNPKVNKLYYSPFLDNHDVQRSIFDFKKSHQIAKLAAGILLTFYGTPYVYFGTEIGLMGQYNPMQWNTNHKDGDYCGFSTGKPWLNFSVIKPENNVEYQLKDPNSLLSTYRKLLALRKSEAALRRGDMRFIGTDSRKILAYIRTGTNHSILMVANVSGERVTANLNFKGSGLLAEKSYSLGLIPILADNEKY